MWSEHAFDGQVHALAVDGAQLVTVGATADGSAAWTSGDGLTWEEHAVPQSRTLNEWRENPERPDDGSEGMGALARLGDTLFSFGTFFAYDGDVLRPVGWRSADGTEWESIESENVFFAEGGAVMDLVAGDPGLLALTRGPVHQYGGGIWVWTAETSWVQTTPLDVVWESVTGGAVVWDAVWADGKYVAVGLAASYAPARTWASSWVSTDGRSWQAAPPSADREEAVMYAVSPVMGGGFVAVGCERCTTEDQLGVPSAWISPDGLAWTAVALPADFEGAGDGVLQLDGGLLAVGAAPDGTATWTSADGAGWQAGPILAGTSNGHNLAAWHDEVVLFLYRELEYGVPHDSVLLRGVVGP
ncbi:MAG: hypothetical protein WD402_08650 [Chloroflexota bacterium]